jgi:hypothetical protein
MAYLTGTATSWADLLGKLQAACTANGWTLSGNVLHKGTCYAELLVTKTQGSTVFPNSAISVRAGNGIDGANALTDPAAYAPTVGIFPNNTTFVDLDWPIDYHIHINTSPDEVYLIINHGAGLFWQNLCWGQSPAAGNAGTGNWMSALMSVWTYTTFGTAPITITPEGGLVASYNIRNIPCLPFFWQAAGDRSFPVYLNSAIHGAIKDSDGSPIWSSQWLAFGQDTATDGLVSSALTNTPLLTLSPNAWNNESTLLPIQILQSRPSNKTSMIGELRHSRFVRNDFIDDGSVVTIGTDKWKVYPAFKKDAVNRGGTNQGMHSGTVAWAIRYDGP